MRAAGVTEFGGPEALQVVDVPDEPLGAGEVRLRVAAATVNPTDTYARSGAYAGRDPVKQPPWVPGMDVAGVVAEVGEGVDHVAVGDDVMGIVVPTGAHGGYRENLVLPGDSVVRVPAGDDAVAASTLPMNGLTARLALDLMALQPGQVLAVTGAAGAFGGYVVQLAKADGLTVVADASAADEELVRGLGADLVVRRTSVGNNRSPRCPSPRYPRTVATAPPSFTAGSTSASCTAPSASPSTPSGKCPRIRSATSSPRRTTRSAPSPRTSSSSASDASATTVSPSALASWTT